MQRTEIPQKKTKEVNAVTAQLALSSQANTRRKLRGGSRLVTKVLPAAGVQLANPPLANTRIP